MADELTMNFRMAFAKGEISVERKENGLAVTVSGDAYDGKVVSIPTTAAGTALSFSAAITTNGYCWFKNLDSTNFVEIGIRLAAAALVSGVDTFFPLLKLKPGEIGLFRLATGITVYARADTAAVLLENIHVEN